MEYKIYQNLINFNWSLKMRKKPKTKAYFFRGKKESERKRESE